MAPRPLPTNIKCNRCHVAKGKDAFSQKQQTALRELMAQMGPRFNPTTAELITCIPCAPQVEYEFKCKRCNKVKGRDGFFKQSLKGDLRDNPTCQVCTLAIANGELSSDDDAGSSDDDEDDEEESGNTAPPESIAAGSRNGASSGRPDTSSGGVSLAGSTY